MYTKKQISYLLSSIFLLLISFIVINTAVSREPISILNQKQFLNNIQKQEQLKRKLDVTKPISITNTKLAYNKINKKSDKKIKNEPKIITQKTSDTPINDKISTNILQKLALDQIKDTSITAHIARNLTRTTITFSWNQPVKAAVFTNDNKLWMIFDKFSNIQFIDDNQRAITNADQADIKIFNIIQKKIDENNTFIIADIKLQNKPENRIINTYKHGNDWVIDITNTDYNKSKDIKISTKLDATIHTHLEINTKEKFYQTIDYIDPFTNQNISIVPLEKENRAMQIQRDFVDFKLLETAQGIAIDKISENIIFQSIDNESFSITKKYGLNIAPEIHFAQHDDLSYNIMRSSEKTILNIVDFQAKKEPFMAQESELIRKIISAKPSFKSRARLELAMFYFAHGFYNEAKAVLNLAKQDDKILRTRYQITILSAALEFFTKNHQEAMRQITQFDITNVPLTHMEEFKFWQSIISYKNNKDSYQDTASSNTIKIFINSKNNFLQYYTKEILSEIGFTIFEHKIKNNILNDSNKMFNIMSRFDNLNKVSKNRLNYDLARYHALNNNNHIALKHFNACLDGFNDDLHYNRCQYDRAILLKKLDMINEERFIEILERIRLRWSGDAFEVQILKELYDRYNKNNNIVDALRIGESVIDNYPTTIDSVKMSNNMSKDFINFFLKENNNNIDLIKSLEVFFEFQHMLPIGSIGDTIMLKVADYMYKLDLLDEYTLSLSHQVKNRLTGLKKERVINKLAIAYMENLKPLEAINVINLKSQNLKLPETLEVERKYITAEALRQIGRDNEAIALLKNDMNNRADEIKGKIFWKNKDWRSFNDFSEPYIYSIRNEEFILNNNEIERIMKQMISYFNSEEYELLKDLYEDFKDRIPNSSKHYQSIKLLSNIAKLRNEKNDNDIAFNAEEIYQLTSEMINSLKGDM